MKRVGVSFVLTGLCLVFVLVSPVRGQTGFSIPPLPTGSGPQRKVKAQDNYPPAPNLSPSFIIPAGPLGFSIPGDSYLLRHQSLVSLDFLDENRLLFTFHVSGLMKRDADVAQEDKQQIRALILEIPSGKIESQAEWVVPDRSRYLWMLRDGSFLLRVKEGLDRGDGRLKLAPYLRFPGRLLWIQMDPGQQIMVTNSVEAANAEQTHGDSGNSKIERASQIANVQKAAEKSELVVRTVRLTSGEVMHVNRFPWTSQSADWPMNSEGYLERLHEKGAQWLLRLSFFGGGGRDLVHVTSTCEPKYDFISQTELLVARCDPDDGAKLTAMSTRGETLWETKAATNAIWPLLISSRDGSRVARETLVLKRSVERYKRLLGASDFEGQMVRVSNSATGKAVLEAPLIPIFDGGGNVAISPSGKQVAILSAGAIQVFQLPAASQSAK